MKMRNTRRFRKRTKRNTRRRKNLKGGFGGLASKLGLSGLVTMSTEQKIEALNDEKIQELSEYLFYQLGWKPTGKPATGKAELIDSYRYACDKQRADGWSAHSWCHDFKIKVADLYDNQKLNATYGTQPANVQPATA